ncbi:MAG: cryptochrome/photolyase family protein [Solirubrobacteraceae bacterium]
MTALMWFRRDLRLHDNPALQAALLEHDAVMPAFCLDPRLLEGRRSSPSRTAFLLACLHELRAGLERLGSGLVLRTGRPELEIPRLAYEVGATDVFAGADVSPFAQARDRRVADALADQQAGLHLLPGQYVLDDLHTLRTGSGGPYTVFTPFYKRWLREARRQVQPAPQALPPLPEQIASAAIPELTAHPRPTATLPDASEAATRTWAQAFLTERLASYSQRHDMVADESTSELSAQLHFGCLSARAMEASLPDENGAEAFRRQLCWRDFYAHVLVNHPDNVHTEHQPRLRRRIIWSNSRQHFQAWTEGKTGYPLVDAGMRQLLATGWMHNRARLVVASFLVKDLGIDWRWGERWFMRYLLDGDVANNNGNWQWIASVGVDPQPVARRILNPTLQQLRFDPEGRYVRSYVPELSRVPATHLAEPWRMPEQLQQAAGCLIGTDYPAPIVNHLDARRHTLQRYSQARDPS